ncbi:phage/plasmid primase, P4 family [Rhodopirellula europaea]|uniref:phage/plasmid primase, P4 family n=1 Tax=Rhodopirellula europaea TaxID=1263866 RepID=UPI003D2AAFCF|tara:strand:- start:423 stop:3203 length:2781 start_codon:yes stop_codon:yes gene_type:complete
MIFSLSTSEDTYSHRGKASSNRRTRHQRIDIDAVRSVAEQDWPGIISQLANVSIDLLDGEHHPCPKCGGTDRFNICRSNSGSLFCNQCCPEGTRDGFGSIAWLNEKNFKDSLQSVADLCGVSSPAAAPQSSTVPVKQPPPSLLRSNVRTKRADLSEEEANLRHEVYSRLAKVFGVSGKHRDDLRSRGLTDEEIDRRGYWSVGPQGHSLPILKSGLHKRSKEISQQVPGVFPQGSMGLAVRRSCMMIPIRDVQGRIIAIKCRADESKSSAKYVWLTSKSKQHDGPSPGSPCHVPLPPVGGFEREPSSTIGVSEGPLKSDICTALSGSLVVGIAGVGSWRTALPVIDHFQPKRVQIAMDADAALNKAVGGAVVKLFREIEERTETKASLLVWDVVAGKGGPEPKGLDDLLCSGQKPTCLIGDEAKKHVAGLASTLSIAEQLEDLRPGEDPHDPARLARRNVAIYLEQHGGRLRFWQGGWWRWKSGSWSLLEPHEIEVKLRIGLDRELDAIAKASEPDGDGQRKLKKCVTKSLVANVEGAMRPLCYLSGRIQMPCWLDSPTHPRELLALKNGLIDIDRIAAGDDPASTLIDHSPKWFAATRLDFGFDPSATCPTWDDYLSGALDDPGLRDLLQEFAGYCLRSTNPYQRFLALEGPGGSGKTVFTVGLSAMLGERSVANASLEEFGRQFGLVDTLGKNLNVDSDVEQTAKFSEGRFKKFAAGEALNFEIKGGRSFSQRPSAKILLAWNERPVIRDASSGFWRRMLLVPFTRVVPKEKCNTNLLEPGWWRKSGELPGILNWAIAGLQRLHRQNGFSEPPAMQRLIHGYRRDQNPRSAFVDDVVQFDASSGAFTPTASLVASFRHWCIDNASPSDAEEMTNRSMGKLIATKFPEAKSKQVTLNTGERVRGFVGVSIHDHEERKMNQETLPGV